MKCKNCSYQFDPSKEGSSKEKKMWNVLFWRFLFYKVKERI
jgi:deoxyribodipyrimidine photolyase-like uncharacterized protein